MSMPGNIDTSDIISRVQSEGWTDLAIVQSEGEIQTQVQRGWTSDHVVVSDSVSLALISQLPKCSHLKRLALPGANLGEFAARIGRLDSLTHLDIRSNFLTQSTLEQILSSQSNLEFLDISSNHIPSLGRVNLFASRDTLRTLRLHKTDTDLTTIRKLGDFEFLEELNVSHNIVNPTFLRQLAPLRRLKRLSLVYCKINDATGAHLGNVRALEHLNLQGNYIGAGTTKSLVRIKDLAELIVFNANLTDADLCHLAELHTLTLLAISGKDITNHGSNSLGSLRLLECLTLHAEQVGDQGCQFLIGMPRLSQLDVSLRTFGRAIARALEETCSELRSLSMAIAQLPPEIPFSLTNRDKLQNLSIRTRQRLPPEWLDHLPRASLQQLQLSSETQIGDQGAASVSAIKSLVRLTLPENNITAVGARHIASLTQLEHLSLNGNPIGDAGADAISEISSLVRLELRSCQIGSLGARSLGKLKKLRYLILERNHIGDKGMLSLGSLPSLEHLDLLGNGIGDSGAEVFSEETFPLLSSLNFPSNNIGSRGVQSISRVSSLKSLSLSGNPVGDEGLDALIRLRKLTSLHLTGHQIGPVGAQALARIGSLVSLGIQNAHIGPDGARSISRLPELQSLHIMGCEIGDVGIQSLLGMKRLKYLHADRNGIETVSFPGKISGIVGLFLSGNRISDQSLLGMCEDVRFENLEELNLSNNEISDDGLDNIYRLSTLRRLRLGGNRLSRLSGRLTLLEHLAALTVEGNPLEPDVLAASRRGILEITRYLRESRFLGSTTKRSRYDIEPICIAEGGQARVSRARDLTNNCHVAIKECLPREDSESIARLRREIQALRMLQHPNVMPILDDSWDEGWLTMPLAEYTLDTYAVEFPVQESDVREVVDSLLQALDCAHQLEWIHRDIKPSNTLYVKVHGSGRWTLSDWGLVRRPRGQTTVPRRTKTGSYMGTEGFAAPELTRDAHTAGPPCDFWSLGQLIGWMKTGKAPLQNVPLLAPDHWAPVTRALTQMEATDRPQSVAEVRALLDAL